MQKGDKKVGFQQELFMNRASAQSVWNQISTSRGLSEWFAPKVDITGDRIHIFWDDKGDERVGTITRRDPKRRIVWQWDDEPESFLSMEIIETELSHSLSLLVNDHDEGLDTETLEGLWENHFERLLNTLGLS